MNEYLSLSIDYANQKAYLDDLFRIYPTIPNGIRELPEKLWDKVVKAYTSENDELLLKALMKLELFPLKDSYIAFLKMDTGAIKRNPKTLRRICGDLYALGLAELEKRCSVPKETNRQIGPMFLRWLQGKEIGIPALRKADFESTSADAILIGSDSELKEFASAQLGYERNKGLDLVARINGRYVIGEAKFLTAIGGHQNSQLRDALSIFSDPADAVKVAILDGVCYLNNQAAMCRAIRSEEYNNQNIISALLLKRFLYSL